VARRPAGAAARQAFIKKGFAIHAGIIGDRNSNHRHEPRSSSCELVKSKLNKSGAHF
jgi:hypothetical protein